FPRRPACRARFVDGFSGSPREDRGQGASRARPHRRLRDGLAARVPRAQPRQARAREGPRRVRRGAPSGRRVEAAGHDPGTGGASGTKAGWQAVAARAAAVPAYLRTALANVRRGTSGNAIPDRRLITAAVDAAESTAVYFEKALPEKAASWGADLDAETR